MSKNHMPWGRHNTRSHLAWSPWGHCGPCDVMMRFARQIGIHPSRSVAKLMQVCAFCTVVLWTPADYLIRVRDRNRNASAWKTTPESRGMLLDSFHGGTAPWNRHSRTLARCTALVPQNCWYKTAHTIDRTSRWVRVYGNFFYGEELYGTNT